MQKYAYYLLFFTFWNTFCQVHVKSQYFQIKLTNRSESDVLDINIFKFFGSENSKNSKNGLAGRILGLRKFMDLKGGVGDGDDDGGTSLEFELNSEENVDDVEIGEVEIDEVENDEVENDQAQGQGEKPETGNSEIYPTENSEKSEMMTFGVKHEIFEENEENEPNLHQTSTKNPVSFKNHDYPDFEEMSGAGSDEEPLTTIGINTTEKSNRTNLMQDMFNDEMIDSSSSQVEYIFILILVLMVNL